MPITRFGLLSGRGLDLGKITECKSKLRWLGVSNSRTDTDQIVYQQAVSYPYLLPIIPYASFNPYVTLVPQLCRSVTVDQDSGAPLKWIIEATYSSEPLNQSDEQQAQNPLDRPPLVKWSSTTYQLALAEDRNGEAIVNSAGDYFDPPVEASRSHWTVTIEKNVTGVPAFILGYADAVNESAIQIQGISVSPECAKLMDVSLSERKSEGEGDQRVNFYTFGYTMELRAETWQLKVLDQGLRYVDDDEIKQILDERSKPISSPRLLDGEGGILEDPTPGNAEWLYFDIYEKRDFSVLPGLLEAANG